MNANSWCSKTLNADKKKRENQKGKIIATMKMRRRYDKGALRGLKNLKKTNKICAV